MRLGWIEIQNEAYLLVFHDIMASTFKTGGNRRFFGVYAYGANLCGAGVVIGPSQFLSYPTSLSQTLSKRRKRFRKRRPHSQREVVKVAQEEYLGSAYMV